MKIKRLSKRTQSSPAPTNTSKIHLYVEQCSLKTNWRLAKRLFITKALKTHTQNQVGREEMQLGWTCIFTRGHRRGRGLHRLGDSLLGSGQFERQIGHASPGSNVRSLSPLSWLGKRWGCQQGCRKQNMLGKSTRMLSPETRQRENELPAILDGFQWPPSSRPSLSRTPLQPRLPGGAAPAQGKGRHSREQALVKDRAGSSEGLQPSSPALRADRKRRSARLLPGPLQPAAWTTRPSSSVSDTAPRCTEAPMPGVGRAQTGSASVVRASPAALGTGSSPPQEVWASE